MGRYEIDSKNRSNFENDLMKVYGHCFANGCYDSKDSHHDNGKNKCDDKHHEHDEEKYNCNKKEKEIKELFNFIFAELDNIECDLGKIEKALKRLFYLLDDECSCNDNKDDIKCLIEDLKALNYFINKTKKDLKCLAKKTL